MKDFPVYGYLAAKGTKNVSQSKNLNLKVIEVT